MSRPWKPGKRPQVADAPLSGLELARSRRRQGGQAVLYAVLLLPAAIAGVLMVFNTGQLTASKLKVQNAADAAAFSAMELQARQMNLDAYLNRAMLANEIAMGQAVSILSWSRYVKEVGENIKDVGSVLAVVIPGAGALLKGALDLVYVTSQGVYLSGTGYAQGFLAEANLADAAFAGASQAFNLSMGVSTPGGIVQKTVEQVVRLNAGDHAAVIGYPATAAKYWVERTNFVTTWGGSKNPNGSDPGGAARMASMINKGSQDQPFTVNRDHDVDFPFSFNVPPVPYRASTHKGGGSQLALDSNGNYVWSGADTLQTSVQQLVFRPPFRFRWRTIYGANWAYGGAWSEPGLSSFDFYQLQIPQRRWSMPEYDPFTPGDQKSQFTRAGQVYTNDWNVDGQGMNKVAFNYRKKEIYDYIPDLGVGRGSNNGIARYRDLVWKGNRPQDDMTDSAPRYVVVVTLPVNQVRDSVTALGISADPEANNPRLGWLNMHLQSRGAGRTEGVRAAAAAQVYFRRPSSLWPRLLPNGQPDGLDERANLFSPYWTARLVDLNTAEKAAVLAVNRAE